MTCRLARRDAAWATGWAADGADSVSITDQDEVVNDYSFVAWSEGSTGDVTVLGSGSTWRQAGPVDVCAGGVGVLTVANGGHVSGGSSKIGDAATAAGTASVSGAASDRTLAGDL